MSELLDRLQMAMLRLSQDGALKDRLVEAYSASLAELDAHELPAELRSDLEHLHAAMSRAVPQPRESRVRASVRKMSNQETRQLAATVVLMFTGVARAELGTAALPRVARAQGPAPVVQLFAEA